MATRPLKILLATSDRAILRHASRLLTVFGYQVRTVSSLSQAAELLAADRPDILVVDGTTDREASLALCRSVQGGIKEGFVYKILLVKDVKPAENPLHASKPAWTTFLECRLSTASFWRACGPPCA